jgi:hypothetical protein
VVAQAKVVAGRERPRPHHQVLAGRAEGAQGRVAVVVGFLHQLEAQHTAWRHAWREKALDGYVGAEAIHALPGRDAEPGNEALAFEPAVGEQVVVAYREEVGLTLEAVALVELGDRVARRLEAGRSASRGRRQPALAG